MARVFDGVDDYLSVSAPVTAYPLTWLANIYPSDVNGGDQGIVWLGDNGSTKQYMLTKMNDGGGPSATVIYAEQKKNNSTTNVSDTGESVPLLDDTWFTHYFSARTSPGNDRRISVSRFPSSDIITVVNGVDPPEQPTGVNTFDVGRFGDSSPSNYFIGQITDVILMDQWTNTSILNQLPTNGNFHVAQINPIKMLRFGFDYFWPLSGNVSPEPDLINRNDLTVTGTTYDGTILPIRKKPAIQVQ